MSNLQLRCMIGAFSVLVGAAGWFYMFYSRAAEKLAVVEHPQINRKRIAMRRLGGSLMLALAASFYVGADAIIRRQVALAAMMLLAILALLAAILILGLIDLRLTRQLRNKR